METFVSVGVQQHARKVFRDGNLSRIGSAGWREGQARVSTSFSADYLDGSKGDLREGCFPGKSK